ncbi:MAG: glycosyltransferase family 39 protein [Candidatus Zixiibacteriota bacterium]|nr:MAG: glycosyltransferase family 39 protein [candidate division Zixibacteria bacterium]
MFEMYPFRRILLIFFVICVLVRLLYVLTREPIPVMWDARLYSSAAIGLIHAIDDPDRFGHPEKYTPFDSTASQSMFLAEMADYIEGESVEWLYYTPPTIAEAQEYLFLSGPVYPAFLALVFLTDFGSDFIVVRLLNCLLDGFCILLLMLIARRLYDRRAAIVAGILYVFYLPFILICGLVSPDQFTIFFILITLYSVLLWYEHRKSVYLYSIGLLLGILALTRPTATLLVVPFTMGFLYDCRHDLKAFFGSLAKVVFPFAVVVVPWIIITSMYFGELSVRDPDYSTANFRSSSSIKYEGYDLDYTEPDFWIYPVSYTIKENPLGYAGLLVKKFSRLWEQPYNDFDRSFLLTSGVGAGIHFLIVVVALYGVFLFLLIPRRGLIFLFLIPLYYTAVHVIFHSLARYNLNPMPLLIIAASGAALSAADRIGERKSQKKSRLIHATAVAALVGILIILFLPASQGAALLGKAAGAGLVLAFKGLILLVVFAVLSREALNLGARPKSVAVYAIPTTILLIVMLITGGASDRWAEWRCRLERPEQTAGLRIYVPDDFRLRQDELARIAFDLTAPGGRRNLFFVSVGGKRVGCLAGRPPLTDFYYRKMTYPVFETIMGITRDEMRYWSIILLDPGTFNLLLDRDGYISMEFFISDSLYFEGGYVDLYGSYDVAEPGHVLLPDLNYSSIERFAEKGDPRIWVDYPLSSDSVVSYYMDDVRTGRRERNDLSPSTGRQTGRYRACIEVKLINRSLYHF